ncbi:MAG: FAD-dependent oxidoreductase [Chloroflexi bacterium]|nr:FAD-dependent oxidoreductase [Chloroflexota bacterium]
MKKTDVLILGGGVAGCSLAYFLKRKGYNVSLLEKEGVVGGMARTYYYAGHPYEFGPHVWFWTKDDINDVVRELSDNNLYYIQRRLYSYIEKERRLYRYPVHYDDIAQMPDAKEIIQQLSANRDKNMKLVEEKLPRMGHCTFEEYFVAALGKNLYQKFMENYSHKMWAIPGNLLQTSMVWADRIKDHYEGLAGYDPLKFEDHTLGKGIAFQVYPKGGWNIIWERMVEGANKGLGIEILGIGKDSKGYFVNSSGGKYHFGDYGYVINTLSVDQLWGENSLPYTGRIIVPFLLPGIEWAFPNGAESIHYPGNEFQTRITEMKRITGYESPDTLILIEIPVTHQSEQAFPDNVKCAANFRPRAYPQQSKEAIAAYEAYVARGQVIGNLIHCGRYGEYKYWGMPETVNSAYQLVKARF